MHPSIRVIVCVRGKLQARGKNNSVVLQSLFYLSKMCDPQHKFVQNF
jgi:hypothetical protein